MTPEDIFSAAGLPAVLGWAILILAPRGRWPALDAVPAILVPGALGMLYAALILPNMAAAGGGFGSLAEVRTLFLSDWMLLAGWVHYLAFDLMVGVWAAARMDRAGVARLVQAPLLVTLFLLGPLGLVLVLVTLGLARPLGRLTHV